MGIFNQYENIEEAIDEAIQTFHPEYSRDPETGQFIKGKSGNPKGRPKKNIKTKPSECLNEILSQSIKITINGKNKKVTCLEAMIQKLVNEIMTSNDTKLLLQFLKTFGPAINIKDEIEKCIKSVNEESGTPGYELQARFNQLLDLINGFDRTNMIPEEYIIDN